MHQSEPAWPVSTLEIEPAAAFEPAVAALDSAVAAPVLAVAAVESPVAAPVIVLLHL